MRGIGLIPAYAGRTSSTTSPEQTSSAHPRLRGADKVEADHPLSPLGSSPLTRGGLSEVEDVVIREGLIPAYAGRTRIRAVADAGSEAHPRLRGADGRNAATVDIARGSSPLTRGGRISNPRQLFGERLIPAYAGRTG